MAHLKDLATFSSVSPSPSSVTQPVPRGGIIPSRAPLSLGRARGTNTHIQRPGLVLERLTLFECESGRSVTETWIKPPLLLFCVLSDKRFDLPDVPRNGLRDEKLGVFSMLCLSLHLLYFGFSFSIHPAVVS